MDVMATVKDLRLVDRDDLFCELRSLEAEIARLRARQVHLVRELVHRTWGPREGTNTREVAGEMDVSFRTADALLETARRTPPLSDRMAELSSGEVSFDRTHALAELFLAGGRDHEMDQARETDVAGIKKLAAKCRRIRRRDERQAQQERHVRSWLSVDETAGFLTAQLGGLEWHTVTTALDHRADQIPADVGTREQRRADALVAIARDWLDGTLTPSDGGGGAVVSISIDAATAADTSGEHGVRVTAGPRIGPDTLDAITCEGTVEILLDSDSGMPLAVGPTTRVVPPKVRRSVLTRDQGCTITNCHSRYRLEVHHIVPRSQGGTHDLENLTTVCWYHHHIAIHRNGNRIDPQSPPHARTITPAPDW